MMMMNNKYMFFIYCNVLAAVHEQYKIISGSTTQMIY